jgi:Sulfatase-modifying factor enzyme 1
MAIRASVDGGPQWKEAEAKWQAAQESLVAGQFVAARTAYQAAADAYGQAQKVVAAVQTTRQEEALAEGARREAQAAGAAADAAMLWNSAGEKVMSASASQAGGRFAEAQAAFKDAAKLYGEAQAKAKVEQTKKPQYATKERQWRNSLGMVFVPVPGTEVLFCTWETRVQDYQAFSQATRRSRGKPEFPQGPTHPAVNVSWADAKAFCQWLTDKERREGRLAANQSYRLPTDGEWSAAVGLNEDSGGSPKDKDAKIKRVYPWGTQWPPPSGSGNYRDMSNAKNSEKAAIAFRAFSSYDDGYANTSPVGSFTPNQYGLYDLSGNGGRKVRRVAVQ